MAKASGDVKTIRPIIVNGKTILADIDPRSTCGFKGEKEATVAMLEDLNARLVELQNVLYAEHKHKVLIVLQATDTGGKDGVIRKVFSGINPMGVHVASFKAPTPEELAHDYLWRVHQQVPGKGDMVVFNRSHYEDVLITRVEGWIDERAVKSRFRQINDFEAMLVEEGTIILKFFLHISKDEQKARLQDRVDDPKKRWKFNPGDLDERAWWSHYMEAYEIALRRCSTPWAPWHVIPADRNWYRNAVVARIVRKTLEDIGPKYPKPATDFSKIVIQ